MKQKNIFSLRFAAVLMAFVFIIQPVAAVFAAEESAPATTESEVTNEVLNSEQPATSDANVTAEPNTTMPSDSSVETPEATVPESADENLAAPQASSMMSTSVGARSDSEDTYYNLPQPGTDKASGAMVYNYKIQIPPGRNGMQPDLNLAYNSQDRSNLNNIVGFGWSLSIPYIERVNKTGSDNLYTSSDFRSSLTGELVQVDSTHWASKTENGDFYEYTFSGGTWTVKDKNGTVFTYGSAAATRMDNPASSSQIYRWMLEKTQDLNGNYVAYSYYKDSGQIYPSQIKYTGNGTDQGIFQIDFSRTTRNDKVPSYEPGFKVTSNYIINSIQISTDQSLNRKYDLGYSWMANSIRSGLSWVHEIGYRNLAGTSMPYKYFNYTGSYPGWTSSTTWSLPSGVYLLDSSKLDQGVRFVDINGDGLVDIIRAKTCGSGCDTSEVYLNNGHGSWILQSSNWALPSTMFFVNGSGIDQGWRVADVNGDALPDLLFSLSGNTSAVYLNSGTGWTLSSTWSIPEYFVSSGTDQGVRLVDVNGDGLPDLLKNISGSQSVYINSGTGWTSNTTWASSMPTVYLSDVSLNEDVGGRLEDVNGDGLPDFIFREQGFSGGIYLNTGSGWDSGYAPASNTVYFIDSSNKDAGVRFADVNGDGFTDLVRSNPTSQDVHVNNGGDWDASTYFTLPSGVYFVDSSGPAGTIMTDVNGDGMPDFIQAVQGSTAAIYTSNSQINDTLNKITYPQGGYTDITYKTAQQYLDSSNNLLNPALPIITNTVQSITNNDGTNASGSNSYVYANGKFYYASPTDRRFSSFGQITSTDAAGNVSKTYLHGGTQNGSSYGEYSDNIYKAGKTYRTEAFDNAGNLYTKTINKWDSYNLGSSNYFVKLVQTVSSIYDGDTSHKDKAESFSYDNGNGNLIQKVEWGEVTGSDDGTFTDTGSDKFTTDLDYAANSTAHISGLLSHQTVVDQSSAKVKETKIYYDGNTALGTVSVGNPTKTEDWKSGTSYISSQKTYNSYGLVTQSTDPRGKQTSYAYDTYNLYPASVTNPLTQVTSFLYDYAAGKVSQTTDSNSRVFQNVYDGLDRLTQVIQPDFANPATLVTKTAYYYTDSSGAFALKKSDYVDSTTTLDSYSFFDGLNRLVQQKQQTENSQVVVKDFVFNNRGLLQKESLPYYTTNSYGKTSPTTVTSLYTSYTYDPVGRVLTSTDNIGSSSNTYSDWKLTTTDPNNHIKDVYKDAYGNIFRVDEHNGTSIYSTYYIFNYLGKLLSITDALSNVRAFAYDGLGRRLSAEDLHGSLDSTYGIWTYAYDDAGNLTSKTDPNNQTVDYTYDDINRVLTEDYTGQTGTEVTYGYDTGTNGIGHLTSVSSSSLSSVNTYNPVGLLASEAKTINGTAYTTTYAYDFQGNQLLITNPDGSEVKYTYNLAGLPETIQRKESGDPGYSNVVTNFNYSPAGQVTKIEYANGSITENTYDPTKLYRLTQKQTTVSGTTIQNITYEYDLVGNITKLSESANTAASRSVDYTYDDLNRLTSATASVVTPAATSSCVSATNYSGYWLDNATSASYDGANLLGINFKLKTPYNDGRSARSIRLKVYDASCGNVGTYVYKDPFVFGSAYMPFTSGQTNYTVQTDKSTGTLTVLENGTALTCSWGCNPFGVPSTYFGTNYSYQIEVEIDNYSSFFQSLAFKYASGTSASGYTENYSYDSVGNITSKTNQGSYTYSSTNYANPHAATSIGSISLSYDNNGNLSTDGTWTNTWNYDNRLTQSAKTGTTVTYAYDPAGQRIKLSNGTTTTIYPSKFYNTDGTTPTKHIFANGEAIATIEGTGTAATPRYIHTDHLTGSSIVTTTTGTTEELMDYYPFGSMRLDQKAGSYSEQRKFTGYELDADTGLNYANARYYNAELGRFVSEDPEFWTMPSEYLIDPQQQNSYSYARNNPLAYIDPDGRKVYALARGIENTGAGIGTHIFLNIVPDNPGDFGMKQGDHWTVGGYLGKYSNLEKEKNNKYDMGAILYGYSDSDHKRGKVKETVEVQAPEGMADTELIQKIMEQYNNYANDAQYGAYSAFGSNNSNNFVTTLLKNSGVENLPWNGDAPGFDPGYGEVMGSDYKKITPVPKWLMKVDSLFNRLINR